MINDFFCNLLLLSFLEPLRLTKVSDKVLVLDSGDMIPAPLDYCNQVPNMLGGRLWVYIRSCHFCEDQVCGEPHELLGVLGSLLEVVGIPFLEKCWKIIYSWVSVRQELCHVVKVALCL